MSDEGNVIPFLGQSLRQLPSNVAAEQSLLGAILSSSKAFAKIEEFLEPKHFIDPIHQAVFAAAAKRIRAGQIADPITLKQDFEAAGTLREVGGLAYLAQLVVANVGTYVVAEYGHAIREAWMRREMIDAAVALADRAYGDGVDAEAVHDAHMAQMEALRAAGARPQRGYTGLEVMDQALALADKAFKGGGTTGLSTGMRSVDAVLGGFEAGTLNVLAGRPGSGKSSLGQQWAVDAARRGVPVLEFSLEMSAAALGRRILSAASGVPIGALRRGQHEPHMERLIEARRELADMALTVHDGGRASVAEITTKCRVAARSKGVGLIVVDHLHLVRPEDAGARHGPTAAVTETVDAFLGLAKQFNVPVLLLAQLNRGVEGREDHRPNVADLRQSGAIEQNADSICFVYREEMYLSRADPERGDGEGAEKYANRVSQHHERRHQSAGRAELLCEKVRDGEPSTVHLRFDGPTASFREPDP